MSSSRGDSRAAHLFGESDAFAVLMAARTAFTPAWKCLGSSLAACSATEGGSQVLYMLVLLGMLAVFTSSPTRKGDLIKGWSVRQEDKEPTKLHSQETQLRWNQ